MITPNGYIQPIIESGGGIDGSGNPVSVSRELGDKIRCQIVPNSRSNKGVYKDGTFVMASYSIFIQAKSFDAKRVLISVDKTEKEMDIQDCRYLHMTGYIELTC